MSRFANLYEKDYANVFFYKFPVVFQKSRIMLDNETDRLVIQFKLMNITSSIIEKVFLKIDLFDSEGDIVNTINEHIITSSAKQGESFGENSPLYDENKNIVRCEEIITKVIFDNGEEWQNKNNSVGETVSPAKPINFYDAMLKQFTKVAEKANIKTTCQFEKHLNCWRCSCGSLNSNDKEICSSCGANLNTVRDCFSFNKLNGAAKKRKTIIYAAASAAIIILAVSGIYIGRMLSYGNGKFPEFNEYGIAFIENRHDFHCINRFGTELIPNIQYIIDGTYQNGAFGKYWVQVNNKYGLVNKKAEWILEPAFDEFPLFDDDGFDWIQVDGKIGRINKSFSFVVEPMFLNRPDFGKLHVAWVTNGEKWCPISLDKKTGRLTEEPTFSYTIEFTDGAAAVLENGLGYTVINTNGKHIIEDYFPYKVSVQSYSDFIDHLYLVVEEGDKAGYTFVYEDGKLAYEWSFTIDK